MPCSFRACSGRSATWLSTLAGTPRTSWGCCASFVSLHPARLIPPPTPANRRVPGKGTRVNPSRPEGAEAECLGIFLAGGSRRREWQLQRIHLNKRRRAQKRYRIFGKDLLSLLDIRIYICIVVCYDHLMGIGI